MVCICLNEMSTRIPTSKVTKINLCHAADVYSLSKCAVYNQFIVEIISVSRKFKTKILKRIFETPINCFICSITQYVIQQLIKFNVRLGVYENPYKQNFLSFSINSPKKASLPCDNFNLWFELESITIFNFRMDSVTTKLFRNTSNIRKERDCCVVITIP